MKNEGRLKAIGAALGMLLLILDSRTALEGARNGLELCLRTVIPALFPFFVLSAMLTSDLGMQRSNWLRPFGRLTGIPHGAESILLAGFLGGYPIGAKCIAEAGQQAKLSKQDAARMMAFCNNPGPSFIFGIAGAMFAEKWVGWALWVIMILSSLAVGRMLPGKTNGKIRIIGHQKISLTTAVNNAVRAIAGVCGWVLLFRVILAFLNRWILWIFPAEASVIITGLLELTNGCCSINGIRDPGTRFVICAGMLAFGGLCVGMQTVSVAEGVSLKWYLPGKLLQTALAVLLALVVQGFFSAEPGRIPYTVIIPIAMVLAGIFAFYGGKAKNRGRISEPLGV